MWFHYLQYLFIEQLSLRKEVKIQLPDGKGGYND
jgi:hypothetical protein